MYGKNLGAAVRFEGSHVRLCSEELGHVLLELKLGITVCGGGAVRTARKLGTAALG